MQSERDPRINLTLSEVMTMWEYCHFSRYNFERLWRFMGALQGGECPIPAALADWDRTVEKEDHAKGI